MFKCLKALFRIFIIIQDELLKIFHPRSFRIEATNKIYLKLVIQFFTAAFVGYFSIFTITVDVFLNVLLRNSGLTFDVEVCNDTYNKILLVTMVTQYLFYQRNWSRLTIFQYILVIIFKF